MHSKQCFFQDALSSLSLECLHYCSLAFLLSGTGLLCTIFDGSVVAFLIYVILLKLSFHSISPIFVLCAVMPSRHIAL